MLYYHIIKWVVWIPDADWLVAGSYSTTIPHSPVMPVNSSIKCINVHLLSHSPASQFVNLISPGEKSVKTICPHATSPAFGLGQYNYVPIRFVQHVAGFFSPLCHAHDMTSLTASLIQANSCISIIIMDAFKELAIETKVKQTKIP